jgi:uncharacterized membrane protein
VADKDANTLLYTAVYDNKDDALADLHAVTELHKDSVVGRFDAAVIDEEKGKAHIVKRLDRPVYRYIPEVFGHGILPRKELKDAAAELVSGEAGLVVVGDATIDKALDKALTRGAKIVKRNFDAAADDIVKELSSALSDASRDGH